MLANNSPPDEVECGNEVIEMEELNSESESPSIVEGDGEEYSCTPPKLFMPIIIILQILFYLLM